MIERLLLTVRESLAFFHGLLRTSYSGPRFRIERILSQFRLGHKLTSKQRGWLVFTRFVTLVATPANSDIFRFIPVQYYTSAMSKHLESLYQNLLKGKLPHNLSWSETVELVEHLGEVQPHGDDEFVFRVGNQRVFFKRPHTHDLGVEEVSRLRKFLKEAGPGQGVEEPDQPSRMIVVIDHHAAHIYQDLGRSRPADDHEVRPYDPFHFHHHLIHRKEAHYRGERVPEEDSFYEEIAKDITPANEIVLIGHATGKSNAADFLKEYLTSHYPDISRRVIASESADLSAVTQPEIEALAKRHMIAVV